MIFHFRKFKIYASENLEDIAFFYNFVEKCFKTADYSTNIKNNIKLVDKFNDLIKNKIFSDKTIKYLECYNEKEIKIDVYNLNILLNAVYQDSIKKELYGK